MNGWPLHDIVIWGGFLALVVVLLVVDLTLFHKKDEVDSFKKSMLLSAFYILIALLFSVWIFYELGVKHWLDYITAYLVEKSLSVDNIFVMSMIFQAFHIPEKYRHRVLFWGILGVVVLRGIMIAAGLVIVQKFAWVMYLFGAFLIITGIKMAFSSPKHTSIQESLMYKTLTKYLPLTERMQGHHFFIKYGKVWRATPLFAALLMIEGADLVFAVDSIPAVLAITTQPYVVYTSNIFAILGLRSLYLALSNLMGRFEHLKYSLSFILVLVGVKIFVPITGMHIPPLYALALIVLALASGIISSIYVKKV